jgi:hypothetical protein
LRLRNNFVVTVPQAAQKHLRSSYNRSMLWKHLIWLVMPAAILLLLWGSADKQRNARAGRDGRTKFAPNRRAFWAWPFMVAYSVYVTVTQLTYSHGRPLQLMIAVGLGVIAVMIIFTFPGTIVATADGLEQISWLWKKKQIHWADIVEINTGERGRTVTITGADGTKIVHSYQLPDRPGLLKALKDHCGEQLPPDFPREPSTPIDSQ